MTGVLHKLPVTNISGVGRTILLCEYLRNINVHLVGVLHGPPADDANNMDECDKSAHLAAANNL